jgi:hypothetical protein
LEGLESLLSPPVRIGEGKPAAGERAMRSGLCRDEGIEFSLRTLLWLGVLAGEMSWFVCRCFAGGTPKPATIRRSASGGEGVALDSGLLLCIEDIDEEGVMYKELRARVRLPSMF